MCVCVCVRLYSLQVVVGFQEVARLLYRTLCVLRLFGLIQGFFLCFVMERPDFASIQALRMTENYLDHP